VSCSVYVFGGGVDESGESAADSVGTPVGDDER
jgi:hypothetical protein